MRHPLKAGGTALCRDKARGSQRLPGRWARTERCLVIMNEFAAWRTSRRHAACRSHPPSRDSYSSVYRVSKTASSIWQGCSGNKSAWQSPQARPTCDNEPMYMTWRYAAVWSACPPPWMAGAALRRLSRFSCQRKWGCPPCVTHTGTRLFDSSRVAHRCPIANINQRVGHALLGKARRATAGASAGSGWSGFPRPTEFRTDDRSLRPDRLDRRRGRRDDIGTQAEITQFLGRSLPLSQAPLEELAGRRPSWRRRSPCRATPNSA
jgi:hypothetical protein